MLNRTSMMFAHRSFCPSPAPSHGKAIDIDGGMPRAARTAAPSPTSTTLTKGPASAMSSSATPPGILSRRATPPIG